MFVRLLEWVNSIKSKSVRKTLLLIALAFLITSCSSEYEVEDELYLCLDSEFSKQSLDLEKTLDSLEILCINEGILHSNSPSDYRQYYQTNIDQGMLLFLPAEYLKNVRNKLDLNQEKLVNHVVSKLDLAAYEESKFGRISNLIDSMVVATGQITSGTVAKAHLQVLSERDFEHPFYRANILLSLQGLYFLKYISGDNKYIRAIPKKLDFN